jgi:hypothetical protein
MAGWLKEYTKIDPFTIDQTSYSEKGNTKYNKPHIGIVNLEYPVIMVNENGKTFNGGIENDQTDCSIIHPITKYIEERPSWLTVSGERKIYKIPKSKITEFPVLVLAYNEEEYEQNGIHCDIVEILNPQQKGILILKKGKYKIIVKDNNYKVINQYKQSIN